MKERGEYILYLLSRSEKPMCTSELAELMSISTRTVKMEMNDLRGELPQHGAELIAKRNYGYELKIFNEEEFQHYYGPAFLKFSVTKRYSKYDFNQIIVFCRHLVSLTRPITIEQLGQHYAMSPSNLRNYISRAKPYLATFHLTIPPHMRKGVSVVGTEANLRVALMELCAVHSHLASFDEYGAAYRRWLRCGDQERSELRHLLLHLLRESPISLRDTNSQRLSIYLLIARNRNQAGYRLSFSEQDIADIRSCEAYACARDIYSRISAEHAGFEESEEEVCFFAVLLMCCQDAAHRPLDDMESPDLVPEARRLAEKLRTMLRVRFGLEARSDDAPYLESMLLPMLVKRRFGLGGLGDFMWQYENKVRQSPVAMELAQCLIDELECELESTLALADKMLLANYVYLLITQQQYDVKKMNLILVCDSGIWLSRLLEERLRARYGELIDRVERMELYEARSVNFEDYDAVVMDIQSSGYRYPLPWRYLSILPDSDALRDIYAAILLNAYQFRSFLPNPAIIRIFPDAEAKSAEAFYAALGRRYAKDEASAKRLKDRFAHAEDMLGRETDAKSIFLFLDPVDVGDEYIDLYHFAQPLHVREGRISDVLCVCIDWEAEPRRVKLMENCLFMLRRDPDYFTEFLAAPDTIFEKLITDYLKLE